MSRGPDLDTARLRQRLDEITRSAGPGVGSSRDLIAALAAEMPHSIEPVPAPPPVPIDRYNCFEFALGLTGDAQVDAIATCFSATRCNGTFADELVRSVLIPTAPPVPGDLVLYRDGETITHAGIVAADGRIVSKWGTGHLWQHDLLEVPASYGDTTASYTRPSPDHARARFIDFARRREGRDTVDRALGLGD